MIKLTIEEKAQDLAFWCSDYADHVIKQLGLSSEIDTLIDFSDFITKEWKLPHTFYMNSDNRGNYTLVIDPIYIKMILDDDPDVYNDEWVIWLDPESTVKHRLKKLILHEIAHYYHNYANKEIEERIRRKHGKNFEKMNGEIHNCKTFIDIQRDLFAKFLQ